MNPIIEELNFMSNLPDEVGTSKKHNIETNAIVYHVIQQTNNRYNLFAVSTAKHRDALFKDICAKNGVIVLANVIMPTHTHDLVACSDISRIKKVCCYTNRGTSVFIRKERENKEIFCPDKIFSSGPAYVAVKSRNQLFCLLKYLYDNPLYLEKNKESAPYNCFEKWKQGYTKPYDVALLERILGLNLQFMLEKFETLGSREFSAYSWKLFGTDSCDFSDSLFKKDSSKPWSRG